jgi:hypothetical protein
LLKMTGKSSPCLLASSGCVLDNSTAMCLTCSCKLGCRKKQFMP